MPIKRDKLNVAIFASRTEVRPESDLATGGYARGLNSAELAYKIAVNGGGWISHEEWMTYQGKIFDMMNTSVTHKDQLFGPKRCSLPAERAVNSRTKPGGRNYDAAGHCPDRPKQQSLLVPNKCARV
jgi:hypothetical protein